MRPEERDAAYLWDMLNAAREAHMTIEGMTCEAFMHDWLRRRAFVHANLGRAIVRVAYA